MTRPLGRDGQPVQLARQSCCISADVDHLLHLTDPLGKDFSRFDGHQQPERFPAGSQFLTQKPDQLAAPWGGNHSPFQKGFMRLLDPCVRGGDVDCLNRTNYFARNGAANIQVAAGVSLLVNAQLLE